MIETLPEQPAATDLRMPIDVATAFASFRGRITARSQLVWGEHCSECAYPACYAHCAFYTPRSDFNCRRFEAGFEPLVSEPSLHRVRFRQWGKMQGRGPAALFPIMEANAYDRRDARLSKMIGAAPTPHGVKQSLAWRWSWGKRRTTAKVVLAADAFVVQAWSSDGERHPFTLTILNVGDHNGRMFQARFDVGADYSQLMVPVADITAHVDLEQPYLVQIEPVGEALGVQVVFGVCDFVTLSAPTENAETTPSSGALKAAKVVVWDLDETLWTGVLVEDGLQGVTLRPEAVAAIKILDDRGVLQSIASKNDAAEALAALKAFNLDEYFLHPQIHWNPKSGSMATLAKTLSLGLDSFVFIDDQPFERGEVEAGHPMVRTLPHTAVGTLASHPWFDLPVTAESRRRRALYREDAIRVEAFEGAGNDYANFLRASEIKLSVDRLTAADIERVFELSQRTNQLNFNGRKYNRTDLLALYASNTGEVGFCLRCSDRFGDYGLIGFAVTDCANGRVNELFMSCRVQRKRVEHAFVAWLGWGMAKQGVEDMQIAYTPTGRNAAAFEMLNALGFVRSEAGTWVRPVADPIEDSDIVAMVARSAAKAA